MTTSADPHHLWTEFAFLPGSPDLVRAITMLRGTDPGFAPSRVWVDHDGMLPVEFPFDGTAWERILATPKVRGFELGMEDLGAPRLSCRSYPTGTAIQLTGVAPPDELMDLLLHCPGLVLGARGDEEDARWQGEESPQHYKWWYDGDWEHLPRITDEHGRERIDVSGNPGRITPLVGILLWAAQDLWFGPGAALVIDHDAVASLPVGHVTDLGEGRWHVRLWEDGTPLEEIRKAQQVLRDHLGYDTATERVEEIRAALLGSAD